ncbi:MAG: hypothetical protein L0Z71_10900 [Anaerolineae bacterium]|nr:hypothetical protein [Anaerolineae bacterium]
MDKLLAWKEQIARLDSALSPIANRPIKFVELLFKPRRRTHPLDAAGVRAEAEKFLSELTEYYPTADSDIRQSIRKLFENHPSFSWAATLPYQPITDKAFRDHLVLFSIKDHEQDTRDALILLDSLCETARSAGVNIGSILQEIAELSSDVNKYGMGSTRSLLHDSIPKSPS